ncbi:MAG: carboxymuconolactone decarboxylase family protein [Planctomycetota bacterium]|nr:carboxymuconolactone decarboxylase family protein [Planctomycetota bacterium]
MPRIAAVDPASASGRAKELFEGPLKGKHFNIFKSMAASPAVLDAYLAFSGALGQGRLTTAERELLQLAWAQARSCDYCLAAHTAIGKGSGLTEPQTVEARKGRSQDAKHQALIAFALALHEKKGLVSDAELATFKKAGYADADVAEVVANYAMATFTNYFNHVNATPVDFPAAPALS